jgi:hypothetical protein
MQSSKTLGELLGEVKDYLMWLSMPIKELAPVVFYCILLTRFTLPKKIIEMKYTFVI